MTEDEIVQALGYCTRGQKEHCEKCAFDGRADCVRDLMSGANSVIKLLRKASEQLRDKEKEILEWKAVAGCNFTQKELVEKINEVIEQSIRHGGDTGGAYMSNWDGFVSSTEGLVSLIDKDDSLEIVIDRFKMPTIRIKNKGDSG